VGDLQEVVVTATRAEEPLSRVPISVAAFSTVAMDQRGVRTFADLADIVPGVQFNSNGFGTQSEIAIRGIASTVGPATTGVYIDDTPVQVRQVGFSSTNAYPAVFDLQRVEILRGPQGTLFGAGAEGGAVRFITPGVNFKTDSGYMRSEVAQTEGGDISYEFGAARGEVLIPDQLAFRASAYYRRDGGYIDRSPYPAEAGLDQPQNNSNWFSTVVVQLEMGWQPTDRLIITPSFYGQEQHFNDQSSLIWLTTPNGPLSNPAEHNYINGNGEAESADDNWYLPSLTVKYNWDHVALTSNTSYFNRYAPGNYDYRLFMNATFGFTTNPLTVFATPGYFDHGYLWNRQDNWTEELRVQSSDADAKLTWLGGIFLQSATQSSSEILNTPFFDVTTGFPAATPFCPPGTPSASVCFFGAPLVDGKYVYIDYNRTRDKQYAAFGEASLKLFAGLKLTAGVRVARSEVDFYSERAAPGDGFGTDSGTQKENPVTPRFSISDQLDDNNMIYASAAKGYRAGGANRPLPVNPQCTADLNSIGYSSAPLTYNSDSLWSYELGTKNSFFDGRLRLSASGFYIQWKNIINDVSLPNCGLDFIANLGEATSKGGEIQLEARPTNALYLVLAAGYTDVRYNSTIQAAGAPSPIVREGWTPSLYGSPWVMNATIQYNFPKGGAMPAYLRADGWYRTKNTGLNAVTDPTSASYNPTFLPDPAQGNLNMRLGWLLRDYDLSAFVNNLTNTHYVLNQGNVANYGKIISGNPNRPRTFGLTVSRHF
jgi:outer membrane receptor protein involved in Fe transport